MLPEKCVAGGEVRVNASLPAVRSVNGHIRRTRTPSPQEAGRRYGQASLVDMAEAMLQKHGPLRPAELVVAIRETGYRADADPHATMAAVRQLLRRYTKRFVRGEDGRWQVAS